MRKILSLILIAMLLLGLLCGCRTAEPTATSDGAQASVEGVSPIRSGELRQSLFQAGRSFESTEDGFYSLVDFEDGSTILLYCDNDSDTLVRVCSRPDCPHNNEDCDAYLNGHHNITYYDGHLYTTCHPRTGGLAVMRFDLDGRNRVEVVNSSDSISGYGGTYEESIVNGVAFLGFTKMGPSGAVGGTLYYYKLDGSMKQPEEAIQRGGPRCSEGDMILFKASDFEGDQTRLVTWTPGSEEQYLVDFDSDYYRVHYCDDHCYKLIDNKFYRIDYGTLKQTLLFDTGLEGEHILRCFPDCIVIMDGSSTYDPETASQPQTLRFYDWSFNSLGEITVDYKKTVDWTEIICGETENRILLCSDMSYLPRYYIDKAEFGTGNITLHEFKLPANLPPAIGESTSE